MHLVFLIADVNSNDPKYRLSGKCHLCMWDKCWKDTGNAYNHCNYSGLETNTFLPAHGHFGLLIPLSQKCKKEITVLEEMIDSEWPVVVVNIHPQLEWITVCLEYTSYCYPVLWLSLTEKTRTQSKRNVNAPDHLWMKIRSPFPIKDKDLWKSLESDVQ